MSDLPNKIHLKLKLADFIVVVASLTAHFQVSKDPKLQNIIKKFEDQSGITGLRKKMEEKNNEKGTKS
jgi:hypothetical protein